MRRWWLLALVLGCDDGGDPPVEPDAEAGADMVTLAGDAVVDAGPVDAGDDGARPDAGLLACPPMGPFEAVPLGDWTVDIDRLSGAWAITPPHGGEPVLKSAPCDPQRPGVARTAGAPRVQNAFGGFRIDLDGQAVLGPTDLSPTIDRADGLTVTWPTAAGPIGLRFEGWPSGELWIGVQAAGAEGGLLTAACADGEGFFGLGTQAVGLDLRGRRYPLWTQEQGIGKPEGGQPFPVANLPEAAYAPMGVWHSSAGYAAVIGHDAFSRIDLCSDGATFELRSHRALPSFVLIPGATPRARMTALTALVGRPSDPPDWLFAPWNDSVGGGAHLRAVAERLRAAEIPSSAIWSEDWIGGEQTGAGYRLSYAWAWDEDTYPDLPEDIEWLHARGFAFLGYFNPFVPEPTRMWTEGTEGGWLITDAEGALISFQDPAFRNASLVDLSQEAARDWFAGYATIAATELGIDGWMADFAEWLPVEAVGAGGESGWLAHNRYPLDWQRVNRRAMLQAHAADPRGPNDWLFFARSGWASVNGGTAGLAPVLWAGDQNTDWGRDDGLPTVLPIGVHAGLAGVAFYGSDIAGYTSVFSPNTDKELFFRWTMVGAFHPVMRTHHGSDECGNWQFDRDAETTAHFRRYARIHTLLFPYLRARAREAVGRGWPVTRHPYLVAPEQPALWRDARDQYFLGDDLLVAPVVEQGAIERTVLLPGSGWWPLLGDAPAVGPSITAPAPATEIPVFVRPGTILPLLAEVVQSFYGATEDGITDLVDVAGAGRLALYPDAAGDLRPTLVDRGEARGAGWRAPPDWTASTFLGEALEPCGGPPCHASDGVRVLGPGRLAVGDAWLELPAGQWTIAWAGAAFGGDAAPTLLTDLDPEIPPPCED